MKIKKNQNLKRGLTLVELSVVVLILGAIIAIVAFNINPKDLQWKVAKLKLQKDGQSLSASLEQYQSEFGKLPTEEQGMRALVEKPTGGEVPENYKPVVKSKKDILDPWKTEYRLKFDSNGDYSIISLGKDGKEGGEGMNKDFNILKEDEFPSEPLKEK
jgi:general secretion pathway protein G